MEEINAQRDELGLAFDTKVIGISVDGSQNIDLTDYACEFVDLKGQLESLIDAQNCVFDLAAQFLSSYSIETEGTNTSSTGLMGRNQIYEQDYSTPSSLISAIGAFQPDTYQNFTGATAGTTTTSGGISGGGGVIFEGDSTQLGEQQFKVSNEATSSPAPYPETQYTQDFALNSGDLINRNLETSSTGTSFNTQQLQFQLNDTSASYLPVQNAGTLLDQFNNINNADDLLNVDNIIAKNLNIADNVLGKYVLSAFSKYLGTNADNVYAAIKVSLDSDDTLDPWNADLKNSNLYTPAKILSSAYAATLLMPTKLENLTQKVISNYNIEINRLCGYTRQRKTDLTKVEGNTKNGRETCRERVNTGNEDRV